MTENLTPEHDPSVGMLPSEPISGEVVGLEDDRVRVRLETGAIGFLVGLPKAEIQSGFHVGQLGTFRTERVDAQGETVLRMETIQGAQPAPSFEHDVNQLQNAINQHHAPTAVREEIIPTMDEQRIQQWLNQVGRSLEKLRRNRAKRLDEEFYSRS